MKDFFYGISEVGILKFLVIGMALFLGLRLIKKGLYFYMRKKQVNPVLNRFYPIVEFVVWIMFLIWGAKQVFQAGMAGSMLLLVFMLGVFTWAGSFIFKDWIAGVIFKAEDRYRIDDTVCFRDTRGRLIRMGYRSLTIETVTGAVVEIPYSALVKESAIHKIPREVACCSFEISVPAKISPPNVLHQLRTIVMSAPWSAITRQPQIRVLDQLDQDYKIEVVVYLVDSRYAPDIEAYVKRNCGEQWAQT